METNRPTRMGVRALLVLLLSLGLSCNEYQSDGSVTVGGGGCGVDRPQPLDDDSAGDDDSAADDDDATGDDDTGDDDDDDDTSDDDDTVDDDDTEPPEGCDDISWGPFPYTVLSGPKASEDLAFDDEGHVIGADGNNIFRSTYDAQSEIYVPNAGSFVAGLRALPNGDIVYSDVTTNTLFRADADGNRWPLLSGLNYGNGLEVDLDGYVYVAEQSGGRVRRVDSETGDFTILAEGLNNPNGISFSPDYSTLYVGSFGGGMIYQMEVAEDGTAGEVSMLTTGIGGHMLDGMAVDACGNVYVCEYVAAVVWRISPDGSQVQPVAHLGNETSWIPNMQWGSGVGGWERDVLYVNDIQATRMYEVQIEIESKYYAYP